jgi:NAD(P)H-hydrate repair Nnr-like enzyme with NAD(P)H-hydrate dehydratase domain
MRIFDPVELQDLYTRVSTPDNGEVTIIGGSDLFHGAPLLSLTAACRIVDMVYFSSPEPSLREVALHLKSQLFSFIWVPWEEVGDYILKSDSVLIGPGMKRYRKEAHFTLRVSRGRREISTRMGRKLEIL